MRASLDATAKAPAAPRARNANWGCLPAHLDRIEQVVDVESKTCACCGGALHVIGEDVAERLDVVPATFRVLVIRGRTPDERRAARQERSAPAVASLKRFLETSLARTSGKAKLAEAIGCALNRWDRLYRFLADGHIEIDSNTVERSIHPLALNRKNVVRRLRPRR